MADTSHSNRCEGDLRRFALDLYAASGVESACLCLQDEAGLDVCTLLWRCWLAHRGLGETDAMMPGLVKAEHWQQEMTLPLRRRRRWLKTQMSERPTLETLRTLLKKAELESEMETLSQLEMLGTMAEPVAGDAFERVRQHYCFGDDVLNDDTFNDDAFKDPARIARAARALEVVIAAGRGAGTGSTTP